MPDMTNSTASVPTWAETLRRGDMVAFHFPCAEEKPSEAPMGRTCLVLEIETRGDQHWIELAHATSADAGADVGSEIRIETPEDMTAAGVRKPTRVICDRRVWVTPNHPCWNIDPRRSSPIIGRLSPRGLARMDAVRAKFQALRDIAAERRSARGRPFGVEHRNRPSVPTLGRGAQA